MWRDPESDVSTCIAGEYPLITSSDSEYIATKRIKQGLERLASPFDELAGWISQTWSVTVLNVIYAPRCTLHAPRLQVVLERGDEEQLFRDGFNYDKSKQNAIAARFLELITRQANHGYDVAGLFVIFSAFAPIALEEADERISDQDLEALKDQLSNPDLWTISRCFGHVTFMFYTTAQVQHYTTEGLQTEYARKYLELLKPHDEFGYLLDNQFAVRFDSKQNFDDNYQSNWYYYYK